MSHGLAKAKRRDDEDGHGCQTQFENGLRAIFTTTKQESDKQLVEEAEKRKAEKKHKAK